MYILTLQVPSKEHVDVGLLSLGSITVTVWEDENSNGIFDKATEVGFAQVSMELILQDGTILEGPKYADSEGKVFFNNLDRLKIFKVRVFPPTGFSISPQDQGSDDSVDSDVNSTTGITGDLSLIRVPEDDIGVGLILAAEPSETPNLSPTPALNSISVTVWEDADGDGIIDLNDEIFLEGYPVSLIHDNAPIGEPLLTDQNGRATFTMVDAGVYQIEAVITDGRYRYSPTGQGSDYTLDNDIGPNGLSMDIVIEAGTVRNDIGVGLVPRGTISGRVWIDSDLDGILGTTEGTLTTTLVLLAKSNEVNTTGFRQVLFKSVDEYGEYIFDDLDISVTTYQVQVQLPTGYSFTIQREDVDEAVNSNINPRTSTTSDIVLSLSSRNREHVNAGLVPLGSITVMVWEDEDGDGIMGSGDHELPIHGLEVELLEKEGSNTFTKIESSTTNVTGKVTFDGLDRSQFYQIVVLRASPYLKYDFAPQNQGMDDTKDSDVDHEGKSAEISIRAFPGHVIIAAGIVPGKGSIGDTVWLDNNRNGLMDVDEPGVQDVDIILYAVDAVNVELQRTSTNQAGWYTFTNLDTTLTYQIQFIAPIGREFTTQGQGIEGDSDADSNGRTSFIRLNPGENRTDVDAGLLPTEGVIVIIVWLDANGDGIRDNQESNIGEVSTLLKEKVNGEYRPVGDSRQTNSNGSLIYVSLVPGVYQVQVLKPDGFFYSPENRATDRMLGSDVDDATGTSSDLDLTSNLRIEVHAGLVPACSIGDTVWSDLNANGVRDIDEPGVPNVVVILYVLEVANLVEIERTFTDQNGEYHFPGLDASLTYRVQFQLPSDFSQYTTKFVGGNSEKDSDVNMDGSTDEIHLLPGQINNSIDCGLIPSPILGSIGDRVWFDENRDGVQNPSESGIRFVRVQLYEAASLTEPKWNTRTDETGYYRFQNLPAGDYVVEFIAPPGGVFTQPGRAAENLDSDVVSAGRTGVIQLGPGSLGQR